jgi:hypothetical protein
MKRTISGYRWTGAQFAGIEPLFIGTGVVFPNLALPQDQQRLDASSNRLSIY